MTNKFVYLSSQARDLGPAQAATSELICTRRVAGKCSCPGHKKALARPAGLVSAVGMSVVQCLRPAMTGGYGISRRSPLHCASKHNIFLASRRGLVSRSACLRQQSRRLQHLNVSAIAAPELGTPDAIAGTVCASLGQFHILCTCCHVRGTFRCLHMVFANSMALLMHIHIYTLLT